MPSNGTESRPLSPQIAPSTTVAFAIAINLVVDDQCSRFRCIDEEEEEEVVDKGKLDFGVRLAVREGKNHRYRGH
jgi:hypothetical protein